MVIVSFLVVHPHVGLPRTMDALGLRAIQNHFKYTPMVPRGPTPSHLVSDDDDHTAGSHRGCCLLLHARLSRLPLLLLVTAIPKSENLYFDARVLTAKRQAFLAWAYLGLEGVATDLPNGKPEPARPCCYNYRASSFAWRPTRCRGICAAEQDRILRRPRGAARPVSFY